MLEFAIGVLEFTMAGNEMNGTLLIDWFPTPRNIYNYTTVMVCIHINACVLISPKITSIMLSVTISQPSSFSCHTRYPYSSLAVYVENMTCQVTAEGSRNNI